MNWISSGRDLVRSSDIKKIQTWLNSIDPGYDRKYHTDKNKPIVLKEGGFQLTLMVGGEPFVYSMVYQTFRGLHVLLPAIREEVVTYLAKYANAKFDEKLAAQQSLYQSIIEMNVAVFLTDQLIAKWGPEL